MLLEDHVHLTFYIWLPDNNGLKVVGALKRAAARKVTCRAMADRLGSRLMIEIPSIGKPCESAGVQVATALPIGNLLLRPLRGRIDLRNHRKILVIDDRITYCGSQNCADPEFRIKAKFAPWVDALMRFEGPIARQNSVSFRQRLDGGKRMAISRPCCVNRRCPANLGLTAQVIGTGPTVYNSAMPEVFQTLIYTARRELVITAPYYVPDEGMQTALCASARRGVATTIIFPARNDSWIVGAASRSYYSDLLAAGVRIYEYRRRPPPYQVTHIGRGSHADRLGQHGPAQFRFELRKQHSVLRSNSNCRDAPPSGRLSCLLPSRHRRDGGPMADDPPALEQHHCDAGANFVRIRVAPNEPIREQLKRPAQFCSARICLSASSRTE